MKLIVGLGNPGIQYEGTRHNMGFEVVDLMAGDLNVEFARKDCDGVYAKGEIRGEQVVLLKPQTYMNLSGTCAVPFLRRYKISPEDMVVVCDDMAIKPGQIRPRSKGSSGGQKGLQNIIDLLGSQDFKRLRIGTGEPAHKWETVDYVLGTPNATDRELIDKAQNEAVKFLELFVCLGWQKAMDAVSRKIIEVDSI